MTEFNPAVIQRYCERCLRVPVFAGGLCGTCATPEPDRRFNPELINRVGFAIDEVYAPRVEKMGVLGRANLSIAAATVALDAAHYAELVRLLRRCSLSLPECYTDLLQSIETLLAKIGGDA